MPETINLRAYLARLEEHLRAHATDEVVHHCRHILQYFPKHVDTYRLLGRALLYNARWDEASAVLLRVLAVYPDDYVAHLGLAEVYGERNKGNDAIWHLERAFEHEPNNEELIASLRDLYKRFRGAEYGKIQLTAGAIARQYGRNGLYEQAIDTLRQTLEGHGDRVDLRLLLAQMMWGADQTVEAAEVALDVLNLLPDCLEANRILTRLWLLEDRPSDAQRYINRIEALDPYIALELATGAQAPDGAFTLPELDYRRYAESVLTTDQPDWLQDIGENSVAAVFAETVRATRTPTPAAPKPSPDDATSLPENWLTDTDISRLKPTTNLPSMHEAAPDLDLRFDDTLDDVEAPEPSSSVAARDLLRETSSLANIFATRDDENGEEVPDWLANVDDEPQAAPQPLESSADPLAWLRDSGIELEAEDVAGAAMPPSAPLEPQPPDNEDPLAWLRESGIEVDESDLAALTHEMPSVAVASDDEDPLGWLRDSGIEFDESASAPVQEDPYETADDMPISDPASDPLGWMSAYSDDIIWSEDKPATTAEASSQPAAPAAPDDSLDNWLTDSDIDFEPAETAPETPTVAPVGSDDDDSFAWLQDEALLDEPDAAQAASAVATQTTPAAHNEDRIVTGMLRHINFPAEPKEMTILENNDDAAAAAPADEFDWLMDAGGSAQVPAPQEAQTADRREAMSDKDNNLNPDWRDEDEQAAGDNSSPEWLRDFAGAEDLPTDAPALPAEDVPEWLAALGPTYAQPESLTAEQQSALETPSEADDNAAFTWTAQLDDEDDATPPAQANAAEDFPAWLHAEELAVSSAKESPNPDWLTDFQTEDDLSAESETPVEADIPDWLSALQPPEASGTPVVASLDDDEEAEEGDLEFGWIDQMIQQDEDESTPLVTRPEASTSPAESEISWLPDFGADEEDEAVEEESPVGLEMPDWLSNLAETETPGAGAPVAADEVIDVETFEWASELDEADAEQPAAVAPAAVSAPSAPDAESFTWENSVESPAASFVDDTPEWLKDFEMENEPVAAAEDEATVVTVQPGEQPEWLSETLATQANAVAEPEEQAVSALEEFEFEFTEDQAEPVAVADSEHVPAQNAPDWLNAMVPGVDLDYMPESEDSSEPEPALPVSERRTTRDFEWLVDIVEEETQPTVEPVVAHAPETPRFSFSKLPAWLRGQQASVGRQSDNSD